jgi:hypothetical protein
MDGGAALLHDGMRIREAVEPTDKEAEPGLWSLAWCPFRSHPTNFSPTIRSLNRTRSVILVRVLVWVERAVGRDTTADFPAWQHEALPMATDILAMEPIAMLSHDGTLVSRDRGA